MAKTASTNKPKPETPAEDTATETTESKADRKRRTDAERIAALEAELAAVRNKAADRAKTKLERLNTQRDALVSKRDDLNAKIEAVEAEIKDAEKLADQDTDGD
jgi:hypothetical protein